MVKSCVAYNCRNKFVKGINITFHRFPFSKPELLKKWIVAVKRKEFRVTKFHFLCSEHFVPDSFLNNYKNRRILKDDAVPTVFSFPPHLQRKEEVKPRTTMTAKKAIEASNNEITGEESNPDVLPMVDPETGSQHDHPYHIVLSPKTLKRKHSEIRARKDETIKQLRKCLFVEKQKNERQQQKIMSLSELVSELRAKNLINEETASLINQNFSQVSVELFRRMFSSKNSEYSDTLKSFSLTLYFYSPRAYNYVRTALDLALPHPNTLRSWYNSVDGRPGFTTEALTAISERVKLSSNQVFVCLTFDEMSIKRCIDWDGKEFVGYVDRGTDIQNQELEEAKEVLVLLVTGINTDWKIPIAYFLINGMSADEKAGVIHNALLCLHEVNVKCVCLTFDGLHSNMLLASKLGANWSVDNMEPYFLHPITSEKVFIILDACHMIKLARNLFADIKVLVDVNGNIIKWEYIEELDKLQTEEGLVLANKLRKNHVIYLRQKMKVKLAVQVLSSSVSISLRYLSNDLKHEKFKDASGTADFCEMFDQLFDIGNCKSPFATGFKSALRISNKHIWEPFLIKAEKYLLGLKDVSGKEIYKTRRKTAVVGFLCLIRSIRGLFAALIETGYLKYLLMYKFSQDHVEMFFCMVRGRFGWNNNPSALQFRSAYRQLLVRNEVKSKQSGNCTALSSPLLSWSKGMGNDYHLDPVIFSQSRVTNVGVLDSEMLPTEYECIPEPSRLSEYSKNIVVYIAGFVARNLGEVIMCSVCVPSLFNNGEMVMYSKFLSRKDKGGLVLPSQSVVEICLLSEKHLRLILAENGGKPPKGNICMIIQIEVMKKLEEMCVFPELYTHSLENLYPESHSLLLVKSIVKVYLKVRLNHVAGSYNIKMHKQLLRQHLNKTVLFLNQ